MNPSVEHRPVQEPGQLFGAIYAALDLELDWELLGRAYCEGDSSEFFDAERRERLLDTGLWIANDLARMFPDTGPRRSVYVGAAVAELAPILVEHLVLGREVHWLNLDTEESRELARALGSVGASFGVTLPHPSARSLGEFAAGTCDHAWLVSVLTDPDAFPALHDELYGRHGTELATGRGVLAQEHARATELARALLRCAAGPAILSTTDDELALLVPLARELGHGIDIPTSFRESALVGDRVRHCQITT